MMLSDVPDLMGKNRLDLVGRAVCQQRVRQQHVAKGPGQADHPCVGKIAVRVPHKDVAASEVLGPAERLEPLPQRPGRQR